DPTVEPAHVLLLEQEALTARDRAVLSSSTLLQAPPALLLLTSATAEAAGGPWRRVLRRPAALGSLADAVEDAFRTPARPDAVESKVGAEAPRRPVFSSRRGDPWPMVRCDGCGASRHDETPRTAADEDLVGAEQLKFALEHAACAVRAGA
ncbi:MAG TPA: hypothetical protein VE987_19860, partial [Polyangiaceae bacterium]|nr:hypothetical protein [Polyangiaceae bacterium]